MEGSGEALGQPERNGLPDLRGKNRTPQRERLRPAALGGVRAGFGKSLRSQAGFAAACGAKDPGGTGGVPAPPRTRHSGGENIQQTLEPAGETPWRIAGEVLNTYIVCESAGGCIYLIDKHAAHERINFDRLMAAREPPMRQTLLQPAAAELKWEDGTLLLYNLPLLDQLGFGCEDFGGGAILVREVPADIDAADVSATLEELAECLRTGRSAEERRENLLHSMAC